MQVAHEMDEELKSLLCQRIGTGEPGAHKLFEDAGNIPYTSKDVRTCPTCPASVTREGASLRSCRFRRYTKESRGEEDVRKSSFAPT
jgi:hypothetical protein